MVDMMTRIFIETPEIFSRKAAKSRKKGKAVGLGLLNNPICLSQAAASSPFPQWFWSN
jgi:hypothetical protein